MKRKKLLILGIVVLAIASLIAVPRIVKNNRIRNEIKPIVNSWEEKNNLLVSSFSFRKYVGRQAVTINCSGFADLTPSQMSSAVKSWNSDKYLLRFVVSNGITYSVDTRTGEINDYYGQKTIAYGDSKPYSSSNSDSSSSSSSGKTATCNYCHGTGKVNGDKCPWCGGTGKTYDNAFNDALGGG